MTKSATFQFASLLTALLAISGSAWSAEAPSSMELLAQAQSLDAAAFDAFNHCDAPGQLDKYASYFSPDVEFYHDNGGVTWTRDVMIAQTQANVCGKFRRELVPGSLQAWPIKGFGTLTHGEHRFCQFKPDGSSPTCEGRAEFTILWRQQGDQWQITRAFSYGHRPN